mmetsp:Transcript_16849/g.23590  ORF Transcript_16849/g.23590 Transcript_16849/m.23590 type:complete len:97 (-) Transcript_16849:133-423(-)
MPESAMILKPTGKVIYSHMWFECIKIVKIDAIASGEGELRNLMHERRPRRWKGADLKWWRHLLFTATSPASNRKGEQESGVEWRNRRKRFRLQQRQ